MDATVILWLKDTRPLRPLQRPPTQRCGMAYRKQNAYQRLIFFIWTLGHQSILTNENLQKIGIVEPSLCTLCYQQIETSKHLFLDCHYAKEVWQESLGH